MRILVLGKRQYTNLDLIDDRFGRLWELPLALASAGHDVTGVCLSYRSRKEGRYDAVGGRSRVTWHAMNIHRLLPLGAKNYWHTIRTIGRDNPPDLVWVFSDAPHVIIGEIMARGLGAPLVVDLYDNFESFRLTRIPGVTKAFRRALRLAAGITCVSRPLAEYIQSTSACQCPIEVIENAVPEGLFHPMDRKECRRELGLPPDGLFIGTAGSISRSRGIETLFRAFERLSRERNDLHLALAGALDKGLPIPESDRVHYLGMLPPTTVPVFLSALDIAIICNRESAFGKYCFPQKFYESVACGVPVLVAGTGSMLDLLGKMPEHLFAPEDVNSLVETLRRQINKPIALPMEAPTWTGRGRQVERFFKTLLPQPNSRA